MLLYHITLLPVLDGSSEENTIIRKSYSLERSSNSDKAIPKTVIPDRIDSADTTEFSCVPYRVRFGLATSSGMVVDRIADS